MMSPSRQKNPWPPSWIAILYLLICAATSHAATIQNDTFWKDQSGNFICSQGGGMLKVGSTYYWYGVSYERAAIYAADPSPGNTGNAGFKSVTCYSSTDLAHWKSEGDALTRDQTGGGWFGRMGVVFNAKTQKYVLIAQGSGPSHRGGEYFATSSTPTGPFTFDNVQSSLPFFANGGTGDQTVFQDDDGSAYVICSSAHGRNHLYVAQLRASDFLAVDSATQIFQGEGREGNCMFKYNGRYYFCSSNLHGWNASPTYVISSPNIKGPYGPEFVMKNTELDFSHVTQTGFFFNVNGSSQTTVIFAGDRWCDFGGNGIGYNQWCPLSFEGTTPVFHSLNQWDIDAATGDWTAGAGNNYVLNPSFEADRVSQRELAGWTSTTSTPSADPNGNSRKGDSHSGNFSMEQKSSRDYTATMSQNITGLPNGSYTLSAWVKSSGGQNSAALAAKDFGGTDLTASIARPIGNWTLVSIPGINVTNGQCQVAIISDARANNWVQVDDVSLVNTSPATVAATLAPQPSATPVPSSTPVPTPTPAPVIPSPHFATVAEAQAEAVKRYPQLGVAGSQFNIQFVALYKRYQQERPAMFQDNSWPLQLAEEIAASGNPAPSVSPSTTGSAK
jgi:hypothetical protein